MSARSGKYVLTHHAQTLESTHKETTLEQDGSMVSTPKGGGLKLSKLNLIKRHTTKTQCFKNMQIHTPRREREREKKKDECPDSGPRILQTHSYSTSALVFTFSLLSLSLSLSFPHQPSQCTPMRPARPLQPHKQTSSTLHA